MDRRLGGGGGLSRGKGKPAGGKGKGKGAAPGFEPEFHSTRGLEGDLFLLAWVFFKLFPTTRGGCRGGENINFNGPRIFAILMVRLETANILGDRKSVV